MAMTKKKSSTIYCPNCAANNGDGHGQEKLKATETVTEDMIEIEYKVINPAWVVLSVAFVDRGLIIQEKEKDMPKPHFKYVCHVCKYGENSETMICD